MSWFGIRISAMFESKTVAITMQLRLFGEIVVCLQAWYRSTRKRRMCANRLAERQPHPKMDAGFQNHCISGFSVADRQFGSIN